MKRKDLSDGISPTSLRRFPKYRAIAEALGEQGWDYITSADLARACDMQEILVRKDLAQAGVKGRQHRGYPIKDVVPALTEVLGWDTPRKMMLVGAGRMAGVLSGFTQFAKCNLSIAFAVDNDPAKIGQSLNGIPIISMEELAQRQQEDPVRLAILAVPVTVAQQVVDKLVAMGVRAIMNFTHAAVTAERGVDIVDANIISGMAELCHGLALRELKA